MRLGAYACRLLPGTRAHRAYGCDKVSERHRHRYEFNNKYEADFEKKGLKISAKSKVEGLCEIIELDKKDHPFYMGTQGHPEYKSRPLIPHPIFLAFLKACLENSK